MRGQFYLPQAQAERAENTASQRVAFLAKPSCFALNFRATTRGQSLATTAARDVVHTAADVSSATSGQAAIAPSTSVYLAVGNVPPANHFLRDSQRYVSRDAAHPASARYSPRLIFSHRRSVRLGNPVAAPPFVSGT